MLYLEFFCIFVHWFWCFYNIFFVQYLPEDDHRAGRNVYEVYDIDITINPHNFICACWVYFRSEASVYGPEIFRSDVGLYFYVSKVILSVSWMSSLTKSHVPLDVTSCQLVCLPTFRLGMLDPKDECVKILRNVGSLTADNS